MDNMLPWVVVGGFLAKEVFSMLVKNFFKRGENISDLLQENTLEIVKLRAELNFIHQAVLDVPKIKQDLNEAHTKIRELNIYLKETQQ
jgi:hypothetical protein